MELVYVYRNDKIESVHHGDIVAVSNGQIEYAYGDPYKRTFWRSSAKPFQVVPFILAGGIEKFNIESHELALMTSSHGGEKEHVKTVRSILDKMNQTEDILDCGSSPPMHAKSYREMLKTGQDFGPCNNPCSGKHSHMIGLGLIKSLDLTNYIDKNHIIQETMLETIAVFTQLSKDKIDIAIDGCGVPVFGLPIYNMALAYNKMQNPSMKLIKDAMVSHPYYVAGTDRLDTIIMEETQGHILAKLGAEAVYCMTDLANNIGIAMKISDGNYRALDALVPELLLKHKHITTDEYDKIKKRLKLDIKNHRNEIVGHYAFNLKEPSSN